MTLALTKEKHPRIHGEVKYETHDSLTALEICSTSGDPPLIKAAQTCFVFGCKHNKVAIPMGIAFSSDLYGLLREIWKTLEQQPDTAFLTVIPITTPLPPGLKLLPDENECKKRYKFLRDQQAYALGRLLVKWLLLPVVSTELFSFRAQGKPFLLGSAEFNLSHSGGFLALLLSRKGEVGVDIELDSRIDNHEDLHKIVCHPNEREWIQMQDPAQRSAAFMKCWSRKEAFLKATGQGILEDLTAVDTKLDQAMPTISRSRCNKLQLQDISLPYKGLKCSIATPSTIHDVRTLYCIPSKL